MEIIAEILTVFWGNFAHMSPFLLFGFFVAGWLSVMISPQFVQTHLGSSRLGSVLKASIFGVPLPLCSCAVIPVASSLRRNGASKGATSAFLLSTPQTGVDSILATYGLLGPVFAIFRPLAAFIVGAIGGTAISAISKSTEAPPEPEVSCENCKNADKPALPAYLRALRHGFIVLPRDIGKSLVVGLTIAGLIGALVPADFFAERVGSGIATMFLMLLFGVPIYVCATASIPIAAAMMMKGVTPGAALVFLMSGPATNAATIAAVWTMLGRRQAIVYLLVVAVTAIAAGLALDFFFNIASLDTEIVTGWMPPPWMQTGSAFILVAVLANALRPKSSGKG